MLEKIEELAKRICLDEGVQLYDVELKNTHNGRVMRVYITRPEGVRVQDCTNVSRALNEELDVIDLIASQYYLEVSSPGLERTLSKAAHYQQAVGENVKVTHRNENKEVIATSGVLESVNPESIRVIEEVGKEKIPVVIAISSIKRARTVFSF
jgi:ribosome maturation factor RimP